MMIVSFINFFLLDLTLQMTFDFIRFNMALLWCQKEVLCNVSRLKKKLYNNSYFLFDGKTNQDLFTCYFVLWSFQ